MEIINERPIRPWLGVMCAGSSLVREECENVCPYSLEAEVWYAIDVWNDYTNLQSLPEPGELKDQSAIVYEIIKLCEETKNEVEYTQMQAQRAALERQRAEADRNNPHNRPRRGK